MNDPSFPPSRRAFLQKAGNGFGMAALTSLLARDGLLAGDGIANPLGPKRTHSVAKAQRVIFLFMSGGPSHMDLFDPKPELVRLAGQPIPESFGTFKTRRAVAKNKLLAPCRPFRPRGQCGMEISDFLPHIAEHADELCLLRGCYGDSVTHPESVYLMNTGTILMGKPSLGAWATYGLGTENENMPAFVVMPDPSGWVKGGAPAWSNGFLPTTYQGTILRGGESPILNLKTPKEVSHEQQLATVNLINRWNRETLPAGGQVIGETDDVGLRAVGDRTHVHDIHATILHLLGLDHTRLTFRHNSRNERLTDVAGNVIAAALA